MPQQLISNINGIDIVTVEQDGEVYASTGVIMTSVAADEKEHDIECSTAVLSTAVPYDKMERESRRARLNELLLECYSKAKERKDKRTMERAATAYGKLNPQIRFIP